MWAAILGGLGASLFNMAGTLGAAGMGSASSDRAAQMSYDAQMRTNELNYQMFKENQRWQTEMANTAHQREVSDLRAAGLNPILSATGGSGAVTPNIATPHADSPGSSVANKAQMYMALADGLQRGVSSAADVSEKISKTMKNLSDSAKTDKETELEVGKRTPFTWSINALQSGAKGLADFAKEAGGLISDLTQGFRTQINYMQKLYQYNSARQGSQDSYDFGMPVGPSYPGTGGLE